MRYPFWFPYPRCWLKTLILQISLIPIPMLMRMVGESAFNALEVEFHADPWRAWSFLAIIAIAPIYYFSLINKLLWERSKRKLPWWLPSAKSWGEGIWQLAIVLLTAIAVFIAWLAYYDFAPPIAISDLTLEIMTYGSFVILAYLYHLRLLASRVIARLMSLNKQPNKKAV
ncbi:MAG: hypothetical protein ACRC2R_10885 [Xenococcaceae cyanobacterium]